MQPDAHRDDRLSAILFLRGFVLLALAAIAIRWPDRTMVGAVRLSGVVAAALGVAELAIASAGSALASTRYFRVGHALASIGFGAVASVVTSLSPGHARVLAIAWLVAYVVFLLLVAMRLWYFRRMRMALLLWAATNTFVAVLAATMPTSAGDLLVAGALYTAVLGVVTVLAARWIRRGWMVVERVRRT